MPKIFLRKRPVPIFVLGGFFIKIGRSETTSYTDANTVITSSSPLGSYSSGIKHLIDGTYKAFVNTNNTNDLLSGYANYSKYFKFDLGTSKHVKSVFVVNGFENGWPSSQWRMGTSYICVSDNSTGPLAIANTCSSPFYDGGFIPVNLTGRYVYLYRAGDASDHSYSISEVDILGTTNLVGSATVLTDYSPIVDTTYGQTYGANNLI